MTSKGPFQPKASYDSVVLKARRNYTETTGKLECLIIKFVFLGIFIGQDSFACYSLAQLAFFLDRSERKC